MSKKKDRKLASTRKVLEKTKGENEKRFTAGTQVTKWLRPLIPNPFRRNITIALLFLCFITLLYFNSLGNDFTNWDDQMIYSNSSIRSLDWRNFINIFTPKKASTYQPIRVLSYAVDYRFWELNPLGYHLTNIFIYFLTCIVIFSAIHLLVKNILVSVPSLESYRMAFFTSFLFAAHPVHVEAVTWLAARKEVLHGFFFFLSFSLYMMSEEVQEKKKKLIYVGSVLFTFLLAVLSKPSAVVLPAIFLLYEFNKRGGEINRRIRENRFFAAVAIAISVLFIFLLIKVMAEADQIKPFYGGTLLSNLVIGFYAILYNIKILAFHTAYSAAYTMTASFSILSIRTMTVITITLLLFFFSIWSKKKTNIFFFSFFWFFITLLPYLNIIPISTLLADRYAFLPSFGYCLILGFFLNRLYEVRINSISPGVFRMMGVLLFISLLSGYSYMTIRQNRVWKDSPTLWADAVRKYPGGNLANAMMGVVALEKGWNEEAVRYLEKAVRIRPTDAQSRNNLAIVYWRLNQPAKAAREFVTAIRLKPDEDNFRLNLSAFYQSQKEYNKSEEILKNLIVREPNNGNLHLRLGRLYKEMGQIREAVAEFGKSMKLAPEILYPYEELGNIYLNAFGDREKANYYYNEAIKRAQKSSEKKNELQWKIQDLEKCR